ncbi:MAG: hypothetical protein WCI94_02025 [Rhodospirillales bacterium]
MPDDGTLYRQDFFVWSNDRAKMIRAARAAVSDSGANDLRANLSGYGKIAHAIAAGCADRSYTQDRILDDRWPEMPA